MAHRFGRGWLTSAFFPIDRINNSDSSYPADRYLGPAADFNADGLIDAADLALREDAFGVSADGNDFLAWQRQSNPLAVVAPQPP